MPKCHFIRRRGPIHHPSAHPDKQIRRRLERLSQKHKGSMARLAAQRDVFTNPTPRQDRCFAAALIENWCHHLLHNSAFYTRTDLLPQVPLPSVQLKKLQPQLAQWKEVKIDNSSPSLYAGQNFWPQTDPSEDTTSIQPRLYDGRSLEWIKKTLFQQGAQLRLLTKQKVNILNLVSSQETESSSFFTSQIRQAICFLSKTKSKLDLSISPLSMPQQRLEALIHAWENLHKWSEQAEPVRLLISSSDLADLLQVVGDKGVLNSDKRSRIFVIISKVDAQMQQMLAKRQQIAAQFGLAPDHLTWLLLQPEASVAIFSCPQGHFHLPIYYRCGQEHNRFYICNPLATNYPVLYNKFNGKIAPKGTCSCGFSAPSIELEQS